MKRLRTALLGLHGVGRDYLSALRADDQFELVAVADAEPASTADLLDDPGLIHRDYRSAIVEGGRSGLDLVVIALEPYESHDFVRLASACGAALYHKAPFARNVGEALALLASIAARPGRFVVDRRWPAGAVFALLDGDDAWRASGLLVSATVSAATGCSGWRGDSAQAGGGVLLNDAYQAVDAIVRLKGLPERVYAQCAVADDQGAGAKHDTEDAAVVSMEFAGGSLGVLFTYRGCGESGWSVELHGPQRSLRITPDEVIERSVDGEARRSAAPTGPAAGAALSAFGATLLSGVQAVSSPAVEHLDVIAVIEAAYLSAKTGEPESPSRLLEGAGVA